MVLNLKDNDFKEILHNLLNDNLNKKDKSPPLLPREWEEEKRFITKSGTKVRSKIEKIIADFYFDYGIKFEYEKKIRFPKMQSLKEYYTVYCDFYLIDYGVYHEHFGMDNSDYLTRKEIKKNAFRMFKMKFIYTEEEDEGHIEEVIIRKLNEIGFQINKTDS